MRLPTRSPVQWRCGVARWIRLRAVPLAAAVLCGTFVGGTWADPVDRLYPEHVTRDIQVSIKRGLDYLARTQARDGGWYATSGGSAYPVCMTSLAGLAILASGNTTSRGPYADEVRNALRYLLPRVTKSGLITGPGEENGRPMYGHGFALTFFAVVYGMETDPHLREQLREGIRSAIALTAAAQSRDGGWTYRPGGGDEGSVTVTQIQALRACHNAGFRVPPSTIRQAVRYIERCRTSEGGIRYSINSAATPQLAISAAAVATLYNAGEYDAPVARACLNYVFSAFEAQKDHWSKGGHSFYTHLYAAQAFYLASDRHWDAYYPTASKQLLNMQVEDGSWQGDGIGEVFGTSIALIVLQLPYKYLPIYQR